MRFTGVWEQHPLRRHRTWVLDLDVFARGNAGWRQPHGETPDTPVCHVATARLSRLGGTTWVFNLCTCNLQWASQDRTPSQGKEHPCLLSLCLGGSSHSAQPPPPSSNTTSSVRPSSGHLFKTASTLCSCLIFLHSIHHHLTCGLTSLWFPPLPLTPATIREEIFIWLTPSSPLPRNSTQQTGSTQ